MRETGTSHFLLHQNIKSRHDNAVRDALSTRSSFTSALAISNIEKKIKNKIQNTKNRFSEANTNDARGTSAKS